MMSTWLVAEGRGRLGRSHGVCCERQCGNATPEMHTGFSRPHGIIHYVETCASGSDGSELTLG